ncbi:hypothetical protein ACOKFD_06000 [Flagellimonas sp. S174]|uniref:hypothetical protein n=1 Tax=Flagellimonas sp. S174 TaxID=3410790 RepID=UPI003BF57AAD
MKRVLHIFWIVVLVFSCKESKEIAESDISNDWEFKMISRGDNKPNFNPNKDSLKYIPILLHKGYNLKQIQSYFQWTDEEFNVHLNLLSQADFIKKTTDNKALASVMIIPINEDKKISEYLKPITDAVTKEIEVNIDSIKHKTQQIECMKDFNFKDISLLILSNVLLDNGQINNVEAEYLGKERPKRNNKNYYASFQEKPIDSDYEALGIYGNQVEMKQGFALCRYGNQRYLQEVVELNKEIEKQYANITDTSSFKYPVITPDCNNGLMNLAGFFKPKLLKVLNHYDSMIREEYNKTLYKKEVSYEEYFIWIYHILYTDITNQLIENGHIYIPKEKVAFYIFQP